MSELGKPREGSAQRLQGGSAGLRASKGAVAVMLAILVLAGVLVLVSGCVPTPTTP